MITLVKVAGGIVAVGAVMLLFLILIGRAFMSWWFGD